MEEWSPKWKGSKSSKKQRKYYRNIPLHMRKSLLSVNLSKELRKSYLRRNTPIKTGDKVRVLRGQFRKKEGKVTGINRKLKIYVENVELVKKDGTKVHYPMHPSNLQIIDLNITDKKRKKAVERNIGGSKNG
jgi:large subunit ribosomal protein L24